MTYTAEQKRAYFAELRAKWTESKKQISVSIHAPARGATRASGFTVRKGERSKIHGVTWIRAGKQTDSDDNDGFLFPRPYNLSHCSQIEALNA